GRGRGERPPQGGRSGGPGDRADHDRDQGDRRRSGTVPDRHPLYRSAQGDGHESPEQQGHLPTLRSDGRAGVAWRHPGDAGKPNGGEENMKTAVGRTGGLAVGLLAVLLSAGPPLYPPAIPATGASRSPKVSAPSWSPIRWARPGTSSWPRTATCSSRS